MNVTIFVPNGTMSSYDEIEKKFYSIICPIFLKNFKPYLRLIKGAIFYKLFRDVEQDLYDLEDMINSGQLDQYTQLIESEVKKVRLKCASNFKNETKHCKTKKTFNYKFDENEIKLCYRCKEYFPATAYISVFRNRLAKACYVCRNQQKQSIYTKLCSKCVE